MTDIDGRGGLRDRVPRHQPPDALRDRVRGSLEARGHLGGAPPNPWRWTRLAAAAALMFVVGVLAGRRSVPDAAPAAQARYALLLYGGHETDTGAVQGGRAAEYARWAGSISGGAGQFVSGEELGRVVGEYASSGTAPTKQEPVQGFFLIDAPTDIAAAAVARDCPHIKYGGRVVVQQIVLR